MECLIGLTGRGFSVVASDRNGGRSVLLMKNDVNKLYQLTPNCGMVVCGEAGDTNFFGEWLAMTFKLHAMKYEYGLSVTEVAEFTRYQLARAIRSNPFMVNLLIGGVNDAHEGELYYLDYLGTMAKVPFGAHGYGSFFSLSTLDRYWHPDITPEQGVELVKKCITEINKRLILNLPSFDVHTVTADGISTTVVNATDITRDSTAP